MADSLDDVTDTLHFPEFLTFEQVYVHIDTPLYGSDLMIYFSHIQK